MTKSIKPEVRQRIIQMIDDGYPIWYIEELLDWYENQGHDYYDTFN
jgi:hypothetical protein